MPSIATGANAANRKLHYIGVSGDGDTLSIGLGQFCHAIRRNLNMLYIIENNGVYGLTKGQFSASADIGTKAKKGEANQQPPIDPVLLALTLGATFVARSFSGDKAQLVPLIQAGMHAPGLRAHRRALALRDLQRPRGLDQELRLHARALRAGSCTPTSCRRRREISGRLRARARALPVTMHDGSRIVLRKLDPAYDPTDRSAALAHIHERLQAQEYLTGLLHIEPAQPEFHELNVTPDEPLNAMPYARLNPGAAALAKTLARFR